MMQKHSKNSKPALAAAFIVCLGFIIKAAPVHADTQKLTYDVYAGGVRAVQASMELTHDREKGAYSLIFGARTQGLLGRLAPWHGTFESHGWITTGGDLRPRQHKSTATWRDETEVKDYQYTRDGGFKELIITDHGRKPYIKDIDPSLTQGTTDALSALVEVLNQVARGEACTDQAKVFDGKRSFNQIFAMERWDDLKASKYNIYKGRAARCTVEVQPIAGAWHKKPRGWLSIQEQGRARGTMPTVWMAKMAENAPAIPVKVLIKTQYGALFMHLTRYENDDMTLVAENSTPEE